MEVVGNFDDFADAFPKGLLPWVFRVILQEWPKFPRTSRKPLENRITKPFVGHLQTCQDTRRLPFFFDSNVKLVDADSDTESGEIDIRVLHGKRPKVFFAFECKCLNVVRDGKRDGQAGKYVGAEGMGCFLSGQYEGGSDCGGMIAYVMDNDLDHAKNAVNNALTKNIKLLRLQRPYNLNSPLLLPQDLGCSETIHTINENHFTIYHLFLAYDEGRMKNGLA
jgi:hypothetical protein